MIDVQDILHCAGHLNLDVLADAKSQSEYSETTQIAFQPRKAVHRILVKLESEIELKVSSFDRVGRFSDERALLRDEKQALQKEDKGEQAVTHPGSLVARVASVNRSRSLSKPRREKGASAFSRPADPVVRRAGVQISPGELEDG